MSKIVLVFEQQPIYLEGAWKINELPDECIVEYWTFLGWRDKTYNADYSKQKKILYQYAVMKIYWKI